MSSSQRPAGKSQTSVVARAIPYGLLVSLYLVLAALFTYPLILNITDHTPTGDGSADQFQTIWFFWWMKKALFELAKNPYWTDAIYFPYGTGLGYHLCPLTNLQALAASTLIGASINSATVFNMLVLGSFAVTGLGAYLLIRQITNHLPAAIWGSIFVAVSPYRLWHLNHLNLLSMGWGLLAFYFVIRLTERPRLREAALGAVAFGALFHMSLSDAWAFALLILVYLVSAAPSIVGHTERRKLLACLGLMALIILAIALPGLIAAHIVDSRWNISWRNTEEFSADLPSFVLPAEEASYAARFTGVDGGFAAGYGGEAFLGWTLLAVCLTTIIFSRKSLSVRWLFLSGVFLVLSLGPTLKIGALRILAGQLPYRWLFETLPFLNLSRTPGRLVVLVHLCLVIFAAQGVASWLRVRHHDKALAGKGRAKLVAIITIVICALLFLENTDANVQLWDMMVPNVYHELAADPDIDVIYEAPVLERMPICNGYMYWQTIHGKKVANGYLTHRSRHAGDLLATTRTWTAYGEAEKEALVAAGIDAIVFHRSANDVRLIPLGRSKPNP